MTLPNPFDFLSQGNGDVAVMEPPKEPAAIAPSPAVDVAALPAPATIPSPTKTTRAATKQPLYVDIETIPDESRAALFELPAIPAPVVYLDENDCPAPSKMIEGTQDEIEAIIRKAQSGGNMLPKIILEAAIDIEMKSKKPRKGVFSLLTSMVDAITNEASTIQVAVDTNRKTMSVTPEMCRIVAIGFGVGSDPAMSLVVGQPTADGRGVNSEIDILNKFWELASRTGGPIVGYNVLGFDLPAIFVRSILLDVKPTKKFDMKPWGADVVDLMKARFPAGPAKPLKSLAAWMGIPIPAEGVDGSQVAELFAKDPLKLGDYVRSDITITRELHRKFRGTFCG